MTLQNLHFKQYYCQVIKTLQQYKFLSIFIVSMHVLYFFTALHFKGIYTVDSNGYLYLAYNLIHYHSVYCGDFMQPILVDYFALRPPLYGYFIAFCKGIYNSDFTLLFFQNLLSIGLFFYILQFLTILNVRKAIINWAMPIYMVFCPAHFIYANTIMSETLFEVLVFTLFYQTYCFYKNPSNKRAFAISLVIGLAMITKPVAILIGFIIIGMMIFGKSFKITYLIIGISIPIFTYFTYANAVKQESGYFQFTSMKSFATLRCLVKYSAADAYGANYADSLCSSIFENGNKKTNTEAIFNYIDSSCNYFLLHHKMSFAKIYIKGCAIYLLDPGRYDLYKLVNKNNDNVSGMFEILHQHGLSAMIKYLFNINIVGLLLLFVLACWNIGIVIICFLLLYKIRKGDIIKWLILLFILYFVLTTGMMGISRYRVHIFPILLIAFTLWLNQSLLFKKYIHD